MVIAPTLKPLVRPRKEQARQSVTVMVRGHLLDTACFPTAEAAAGYKRAVRAWALERRVPLQMVSRSARAHVALAS